MSHPSLLMFVLVFASTAYASLITTRPGLGGNDSYDWTANFGPPEEDLNNIPSGSVATSDHDVRATISFDRHKPGGRVDQTSALPGWFGNFKVGDELLSSGYPGNGPINFTFSRRILALGANIQPDYFGPFVAQLCDTNGICVAESGVSNSDADGSAIFIGLRDATGFRGATFSVTACEEECADFAINQVDIVTPTPEPGTWWLFLLVLAVFVPRGNKKSRDGQLENPSLIA